jgi:hypothetical protein
MADAPAKPPRVPTRADRAKAQYVRQLKRTRFPHLSKGKLVLEKGGTGWKDDVPNPRGYVLRHPIHSRPRADLCNSDVTEFMDADTEILRWTPEVGSAGCGHAWRIPVLHDRARRRCER